MNPPILRPITWNHAEGLLRKAHHNERPTDKLCEFLAKSIAAKANGNGLLQFLLADYEYGDLMIDRGRFYYPPRASRAEIEAVANTVGLNQETTDIPVGVVLDGVLEASGSERTTPILYKSDGKYLPTEVVNVFPIALMRPGYVFGTFEFYDRMLQRPSGAIPTTLSYDVSSGSRKVHLLFDASYAPIQNFECFQAAAPKTLDFSEESKCFSSAPRTKHFPDTTVIKAVCRNFSWRCQVLIFAEALFSGATPNEHALREYIKDLAWQQSRHMMSKYFDEVVREELKADAYDNFVKTKHLKKDYHEFVARVLRRIPMVRSNQTLALRPVLNDKDFQCGPFFYFLEQMQKSMDAFIKSGKREGRDLKRKRLSLLQYNTFLDCPQNPIYLPVASRIEIVRDGPKGDLGNVIRLFKAHTREMKDVRFVSVFPRRTRDEVLRPLARKFIATKFAPSPKDIFLSDHMNFFKGFIQIGTDR